MSRIAASAAELTRELEWFLASRRARGVPPEGILPPRYLAVQVVRAGRKRSETETAAIRRLRDFAHRRHVPITGPIITQWDGARLTAYTTLPRTRRAS